MSSLVSDIAFTDAVKARQVKHGSRTGYEMNLARRDWQSTVTEDLAAFIAQRDSFYMASVSSDRHPYIQHRGGPKGFLRVLDERTLGFADFTGNRQFISLGNFDENDRVHLFLMDYANRGRIKLWGRARVVEDDPDLMERLIVPGYKARPERAILITVEAWDVNCPQHIPELHGEETIHLVTAKLTQRIAELEAENAELKAWMGDAKA